MEPMGAFPDGELAFSRMFSTEEFDFGPEFFGQGHFSLQHDEGSHFADLSAVCSNIAEANVSMAGFDESAFYSWNTLNSNLDFIPQENSKTCNSNSSSMSIPSSSHETFLFTCHSDHIPEANDVSAMSMDICIMDQKNSCPFVPQFPDIAMAESACINIEDIGTDKKGSIHNGQQAVNAAAAMQLQLKRKLYVTESSTANPTDRSKKKPRTPGTAQKGKKNVRPNKNQKSTTNSNDKEENNAKPHGQSSSCYSSEDDNVSQDSNGGVSSESKVPEALNSNGKARASRGSATDPQSLYARKRRERINERLRILQNLVPNGTKVDIGTMLEEAVHYVKFLQLQIKLLSSDDLWMYAPIAYNGVDIGLNQKLSMLL